MKIEKKTFKKESIEEIYKPFDSLLKQFFDKQN